MRENLHPSDRAVPGGDGSWRLRLRWRTRKARTAPVARPAVAAAEVSLLDESERVGETGVALWVVEEELEAEDVELAERAGEEELVVEPAPVMTEESWTPESMEDDIEAVAAAPEAAAHIEEPLAEALADEGESLADFEDDAVEAELARDEHDAAGPF